MILNTPVPPQPTPDPVKEKEPKEPHDHVFSLWSKRGERLHDRWCVICHAVGQIEKHEFRAYILEPDEEHPNGGNFYKCPKCGYEYYKWNDEE